MLLPEDLRHAIDREVEKFDQGKLAKASAELTQSYQGGDAGAAFRSEAHRFAYLAVRLPAILACNLNVFSEVRRLAPEVEVQSMLDLGAGPGTALQAAVRVFPSLRQATMIETDAAMVDLGRRIGEDSPYAAVQAARWQMLNLKALDLRKGGPRTGSSFAPHDLVVASYALGELGRSAAEKAVARAWESTRQLLVIIEPGTARGFEMVHGWRSLLIASGARILVPCPHEAECPMAAAGDWCHFAQRVDRTSLHRRLKGGALGHEDEKFSYVVASRQPLPVASARIVRHPQKHGGHVRLVLCTPPNSEELGLERQGLLKERIVPSSQPEAYKASRKAKWGDAWDFDPSSR